MAKWIPLNFRAPKAGVKKKIPALFLEEENIEIDSPVKNHYCRECGEILVFQGRYCNEECREAKKYLTP